MEEKRANPRFRINQIIAYGPNREENLFAEGVNISRNGLSGTSGQIVEPMTNVFIMMHVPSPPDASGGESIVRCEGYVSHSRMEEGRCVFGVKITSVYEDDVLAFEAYLASLEAQTLAAAGEDDQGKDPSGSGLGSGPSGN